MGFAENSGTKRDKLNWKPARELLNERRSRRRAASNELALRVGPPAVAVRFVGGLVLQLKRSDKIH